MKNRKIGGKMRLKLLFCLRYRLVYGKSRLQRDIATCREKGYLG